MVGMKTMCLRRFSECMETNRTDMASNIEIIVGTYEQFLLGYKVEQVRSTTFLF